MPRFLPVLTGQSGRNPASDKSYYGNSPPKTRLVFPTPSKVDRHRGPRRCSGALATVPCAARGAFRNTLCCRGETRGARLSHTGNPAGPAREARLDLGRTRGRNQRDPFVREHRWKPNSIPQAVRLDFISSVWSVLALAARSFTAKIFETDTRSSTSRGNLESSTNGLTKHSNARLNFLSFSRIVNWVDALG